MDRLSASAHRVDLKGESMRKKNEASVLQINIFEKQTLELFDHCCPNVNKEGSTSPGIRGSSSSEYTQYNFGKG
jgi:hypothetical protein